MEEFLMEQERILILIKPDGVSLGHIGEVITRLELKGYSIDALKVTQATEAQLQQHYEKLVNKPFFKEIET